MTRAFTTLFLSSFIFVSQAFSLGCCPTYKCDGVNWSASAGYWANFYNGDMTIQGVKGKFEESIGDTLDDSNSLGLWGFRCDVQSGRYGGYFDFQIADLGYKNVITQNGVTTIDADFNLNIIETAARYRLCSYPTDSFGCGYMNFDVYGGFRYVGYDVKYTVSTGGTVSAKMNWAEPILGVTSLWQLTPRYQDITSVDVGGFGMSSDFSWQALTGVKYYWFSGSQYVHYYLLYRAVGHDYEDGFNSVNAVVHGPTFGFGVTF